MLAEYLEQNNVGYRLLSSDLLQKVFRNIQEDMLSFICF